MKRTFPTAMADGNRAGIIHLPKALRIDVGTQPFVFVVPPGCHVNHHPWLRRHPMVPSTKPFVGQSAAASDHQCGLLARAVLKLCLHK